MIAFIALIGALGLIRIDGAALPRMFEDGTTQSTLETAFDDRLPIRAASVALWGAVEYGLLGQTGTGAVAGREGWLFTDEEYRAEPGFETRLNARIDRIVAIAQQLHDEGVALIPVLLPDKARIHSDHLRRARPPQVEARYEQALTRLRHAGVALPDLRPILQGSAREGAGFLRTDTHWSPEAARAVAQALTPLIRATGGARTAFESTQTGRQEHDGDLLRYVPTGVWRRFTGPQVEWRSTWQTLAPPSDAVAGGLFADVQIPGILVGSSYSADPAFHFEGFLKQAAGADILNVASRGTGPFRPMEAYLASARHAAAAPEFVIWEIPERYLTLRLAPREGSPE